MIYTSLAEIKSYNPCSFGWKKILQGQNKTRADNALFPLTEALDSNSIPDVCWILGRRGEEIQVLVQFAKMCADSVQKYNNAMSKNDAAAAASYASYAAAASNATYAAANAAAAADAAKAAAAAADAYAAQKELNKQFLIQCIENWKN